MVKWLPERSINPFRADPGQEETCQTLEAISHRLIPAASMQ